MIESMKNQDRLKTLSTVGWQNRRGTLHSEMKSERFQPPCTVICLHRFVHESISTPERKSSPLSGFLLLHRHETVGGGSEGCLSAFSPTQPEVKDSVGG